MTDRQAQLDMLQRQIQDLDKIYRQAAQDLNTVRGHERLKAWKTSTASLLSAHVGEKEARQFAALTPGPSFTNDLLEELSDAVEPSRSFLVALMTTLKKAP